ncbi:MAG: bifunctional nuclease family protein [Planctomycetota bacterium]
MVEVELRRITINDTGDRQYIALGEKDGERLLTIVIGYHEAQAIDRSVKDIQLQRPMTHDLAIRLMDALGGRFQRVEITALREGTFYAMIHLKRGDGSEVGVDSRPSDAIVFATALKKPIFVAESVLREAAMP